MASWGIEKGRKKQAFRPAMALSSGELSGISGSMLMMTATATPKTIRLLFSQMPEITNWRTILNSPMRDNVTFLIPPPMVLPTNIEFLLAPHIEEMKLNGKTYLIIVRGTPAMYKKISVKVQYL